MAKTKSTFVCQSCGDVTSRWAGKCSSCGEWNSIVEESAPVEVQPGTALKGTRGKVQELQSLSGDTMDAPRMPSEFAELDRVTGGGIVPASAVLIGGEPGIGKSTLLLQLAATLAKSGRTAVYFSGEEAPAQVRLRAERLGLTEAPVKLVAETNLANIIATLRDIRNPDLVVIDSVQTLWSDNLEAAPGSVSQVRAATQALIRYAKSAGCAMLLVGHVTKEGQIAGPKVIEHMVDTVLYFEGDRGHPYRILRAIKNRFGPTDEIGVFEMVHSGLSEVANPSELFLGDREQRSPGSAVFAGIEGTRPLLVEIQALVVNSPLGTPRRAVVGWDNNRLSMILAVLEARCGISLAGNDVFLNVAGGMKIAEPAADMAVAAALLSAYANIPLPPDCVYFGEISLSGAVRVTNQATSRLKEAQKLGFSSAVIPASGDVETAVLNLELNRLSKLAEFAQAFRSAETDE